MRIWTGVLWLAAFGATAFPHAISAQQEVGEARPRGTLSAGLSPINYRSMREASEAAVRAGLLDPASAQFEWPYGFVEGTWPTILKSRQFAGYITCGFVNSRNKMGGYAGRRSFVVVLSNEKVIYFDVSTGNGRGRDFTGESCQRSFPSLPAPQDGMLGGAGDVSAGVADELAKLAKLRTDGVLSEAEFATQKSKLLNR